MMARVTPLTPAVFEQPEFPAYELVDSGAGEKLERYGDVLVRRPDPQALWRRRQGERAWERAALAFERDPASGGQRGSWRVASDAPPPLRGERPEWRVAWRGAVALLRPTPFKHLGLFPEQAANWAFIAERLALAARTGGAPPRVLTLFGYTGMASVVAARAGALVTHVDASKKAIGWPA